jgi:AraC-like DNA-binding protein
LRVRFGFNHVDVLRQYGNELCKKISARHRKHQKTKWDGIRKQLLEFLASENTPKMRDVAKVFGVSINTLYNHFPDICREIARKYRVSLTFRASQKLLTLKSEVKKLIEELIEQGICPSSNRVQKMLRVPIHLNIRDWSNLHRKIRREAEGKIKRISSLSSPKAESIAVHDQA